MIEGGLAILLVCEVLELSLAAAEVPWRWWMYEQSYDVLEQGYMQGLLGHN